MVLKDHLWQGMSLASCDPFVSAWRNGDSLRPLVAGHVVRITFQPQAKFYCVIPSVVSCSDHQTSATRMAELSKTRAREQNDARAHLSALLSHLRLDSKRRYKPIELYREGLTYRDHYEVWRDAWRAYRQSWLDDVIFRERTEEAKRKKAGSDLKEGLNELKDAIGFKTQSKEEIRSAFNELKSAVSDEDGEKPSPNQAAKNIQKVIAYPFIRTPVSLLFQTATVG